MYSGKALDVENVSTANGALIQVWAYGSGTNQQWALTQVESTARMSDPKATIADEEAVKSLSVFPNPAKDMVTLTATEAGSYTLIGLTGNVIATGKVTGGENNISISNLNSGYYFIRYENEKGKSRTLKLLKE